MQKGDVVLVTFPFTNLSGDKLRPAIILSVSRLDIMVCFLTTRMHWQEPTDVLITPSRHNGIQKESLIRTSKIATLDKSLSIGLLGKLSENEVQELDSKLKELLQIK
jgi:mRNA interferase MazF